MPSLAHVLEQRIPVTVEMYGETWNLTYRPGVLTMDFETEMTTVQTKMLQLQAQAAEVQGVDEARATELVQEAEKEVKKFWGLLSKMIASWDVTETEDGEPLPITAKTFQRLPAPLLGAFVQAIREQSEPGKAPTASRNGSGSVTHLGTSRTSTP